MMVNCILEDDLVLYALGELDNERRRHVATHIGICPACQHRVKLYREVKHHLRLRSARNESGPQRDALKQQILENASRTPLEATRARPRHGRHWQLAVVTALLFFVAATVVSTSDVAGRFPFAQFVGFQPSSERHALDDPDLSELITPGSSLRESLQARHTGEAVPEDKRAPERLPLGLYRVESFVLDNGDVIHYYLSTERGFEITVGLERLTSSATQLSGHHTLLTSIDGVEVLINRRESGQASSLLWVKGETLFTVRIARAFGGLTLAPTELLTVAETIIRAIEDGERTE